MKSLSDINIKIANLEAQKKKLLAQATECEWLDISNTFLTSVNSLHGKQFFEISTKQLHNNKTYAEIQALLQEDEEIASYELLQKLRNAEAHPVFKDFWVFVPNPDMISEKRGSVAWFNAGSDRAYLDCDWGADYRVEALGVFLVRAKKFNEERIQ